MKPGHLCLVGERDTEKKAHLGIEASLELYASETGHERPFRWIETELISRDGPEAVLVGATGVWCVPGSPYANTGGALSAIRHARERGIPFLGTCGGFQHALMEYCASVLQRPAVHQEMDPASETALIAKLNCALIEKRAAVYVVPGSAYAKLMVVPVSEEEFHCSYGVAPEFESIFAGFELEFVARDDAGAVRVFWHRQHPFFVGSLFQPERRALSGDLHPLVYAFLTHAG